MSGPVIQDGCPDLDIPTCLECPLPQCRYDVSGGSRAMFNAIRDLEIRRDKRNGLTVDEIADKHELSRRSVWRVLEGHSS